MSNLKGYAALLAEHSKKEAEILYRWMDRNLSMTQIGEGYGQFQEKIGGSAADRNNTRNLLPSWRKNSLLRHHRRFRGKMTRLLDRLNS